MTGTEALEQLFQSIKSDFHYEEVPDEYCDYFEKIDKELKALELLIKKDVIIPKLTLTKFFDIKEYNKGLSERRQLTDEERTIILEVLKMIEDGK